MSDTWTVITCFYSFCVIYLIDPFKLWFLVFCVVHARQNHLKIVQCSILLPYLKIPWFPSVQGIATGPHQDSGATRGSSLLSLAPLALSGHSVLLPRMSSKPHISPLSKSCDATRYEKNYASTVNDMGLPLASIHGWQRSKTNFQTYLGGQIDG